MTYNELMKETKNQLKTYKNYASYGAGMYEMNYILSPDLPIKVEIKMKDEIAESCRKNAKNLYDLESKFIDKNNVIGIVEIYDDNDKTFISISGEEYSINYFRVSDFLDSDAIRNFENNIEEQLTEFNAMDYYLDLIKEKIGNKNYECTFKVYGEEIEEFETNNFEEVYNKLKGTNFNEGFEKEIEITTDSDRLRIWTEINPYLMVSDEVDGELFCNNPVLDRENFIRITNELINYHIEDIIINKNTLDM